MFPVTELSTESSSTSTPGIPLSVRIANIIAVFVPFLGLIVAIVSLWGWGISGVELGLLISMYLLTVLGITVGYHRLFTHRSFETNRVVECIFAVLGSMAIQGSLLKWVALHRCHHHHSDTPGDPHSPHFQGNGIRGILKGMWYAHIGWFFKPDPPGLTRYVKDLSRNRFLCKISALFPLWVVVSILLPALLGGIFTQTWLGALLGLIWGGLVRIFLVHHVTWSINSICHIWGSQPYPSQDHSRNNFLFGILALGEGWHNNHHAFSSSARHGLKWWQIDISYWVISLLACCRLAWNVRLPNR